MRGAFTPTSNLVVKVLRLIQQLHIIMFLCIALAQHYLIFDLSGDIITTDEDLTSISIVNDYIQSIYKIKKMKVKDFLSY